MSERCDLIAHEQKTSKEFKRDLKYTCVYSITKGIGQHFAAILSKTVCIVHFWCRGKSGRVTFHSFLLHQQPLHLPSAVRFDILHSIYANKNFTWTSKQFQLEFGLSLNKCLPNCCCSLTVTSRKRWMKEIVANVYDQVTTIRLCLTLKFPQLC